MSYGIPRDRKLSADSGWMCEDCCSAGEDVPATVAVAGETDTWGTEWIYLCDKHKFSSSECDHGPCDTCGAEEGTMRTRDPSEGSHGPVYVYCPEHIPGLDDGILDDINPNTDSEYDESDNYW